MCDYSLMSEPNRLAREGEKLVTYRFPHGSIGLAEASEVARVRKGTELPSDAAAFVWFLCGAIILGCTWGAFWQHPISTAIGGVLLVGGAIILAMYLVRTNKPVCAVCVPPGTELLLEDIYAGVRVICGVGPIAAARFTQVAVEENRHRDAVTFPNGKICSLQNFAEGMSVEVKRLPLSADERFLAAPPRVESFSPARQ